MIPKPDRFGDHAQRVSTKSTGNERQSYKASLRPHHRHRCDAASRDGGARRLDRRRRPRRAGARARRLAFPRAHGVQGHEDALVAADRRGDRECRRRSQCGDQHRDDRLLRARAEGRRAACARRAVGHPRQSGVRGRRGRAREERHRAGDRRRAGHARRRDLRAHERARVSGPADGPFAARHGGIAEGVHRRDAARLSREALPRAGHGGRRRRRRRARHGGSRGEQALLRRSPVRRRRHRRPRNSAAARASCAANWSRRT